MGRCDPRGGRYTILLLTHHGECAGVYGYDVVGNRNAHAPYLSIGLVTSLRN